MNNSSTLRPAAHKLHWRIIGAIIFGLACLGSFNLAMLIIDREPPVVFKERVTLTPAVTQGGVLVVKAVVERSRVCRSEIRRWVTDVEGTRHAISSYTVSPFSGLGTIESTVEITVPSAVPLGPAQYHIEADYYCNFVQQIMNWPIRVKSPFVQFIVTPEVSSGVILPKYKSLRLSARGIEI
jgi:hypothetical protein